MLFDAQDGHQDALIEHTERMNRLTKLMDQMNSRVMDLEEERFNRINKDGVPLVTESPTLTSYEISGIVNKFRVWMREDHAIWTPQNFTYEFLESEGY